LNPRPARTYSIPGQAGRQRHHEALLVHPLVLAAICPRVHDLPADTSRVHSQVHEPKRGRLEKIIVAGKVRGAACRRRPTRPPAEKRGAKETQSSAGLGWVPSGSGVRTDVEKEGCEWCTVRGAQDRPGAGLLLPHCLRCSAAQRSAGQDGRTPEKEAAKLLWTRAEAGARW
jgi:hypothetical protein